VRSSTIWALHAFAKIVGILVGVLARSLPALVEVEARDLIRVQEAVATIVEPHVLGLVPTIFVRTTSFARLGIPHWAWCAAWRLLPVKVEVCCAATTFDPICCTMIGGDRLMTFASQVFVLADLAIHLILG
jgi:hypothetical protein